MGCLACYGWGALALAAWVGAVVGVAAMALAAMAGSRHGVLERDDDAEAP